MVDLGELPPEKSLSRSALEQIAAAELGSIIRVGNVDVFVTMGMRSNAKTALQRKGRKPIETAE